MFVCVCVCFFFQIIFDVVTVVSRHSISVVLSRISKLLCDQFSSDCEMDYTSNIFHLAVLVSPQRNDFPSKFHHSNFCHKHNMYYTSTTIHFSPTYVPYRTVYLKFYRIAQTNIIVISVIFYVRVREYRTVLRLRMPLVFLLAWSIVQDTRYRTCDIVLCHKIKFIGFNGLRHYKLSFLATVLVLVLLVIHSFQGITCIWYSNVPYVAAIVVSLPGTIS